MQSCVVDMTSLFSAINSELVVSFNAHSLFGVYCKLKGLQFPKVRIEIVLNHAANAFLKLWVHGDCFLHYNVFDDWNSDPLAMLCIGLLFIQCSIGLVQCCVVILDRSRGWPDGQCTCRDDTLGSSFGWLQRSDHTCQTSYPVSSSLKFHI